MRRFVLFAQRRPRCRKSVEEMQRRDLNLQSPVVIAVLQRRVARDVRLDRQRLPQQRPVLDDMTVEELQNALQVPVINVQSSGVGLFNRMREMENEHE